MTFLEFVPGQTPADEMVRLTAAASDVANPDVAPSGLVPEAAASVSEGGTPIPPWRKQGILGRIATKNNTTTAANKQYAEKVACVSARMVCSKVLLH